jgi:formylglycine-generating enzyme required for sulfatase activity
MGSDPEDRIVERDVTVPDFTIDRFAVTNAQFAAFVNATGYVTDAEKAPDPADFPDIPRDRLVAGSAVFASPVHKPDMSDETNWWRFVAGADWRHPQGPDSNIDGKDGYPVVHVSYRDALAYVHWRGRDLPSEEQFEFAARSGLDAKVYAWGDELHPSGRQMANTWQGEFPSRNTDEDGFVGLAPDGCFPANGYGLFDMVGNVWEWTATPAVDQEPRAKSRKSHIIKGGSFLCSSDFCRRFRPAAHQTQENNFSSIHLGFRTVNRGTG